MIKPKFNILIVFSIFYFGLFLGLNINIFAQEKTNANKKLFGKSRNKTILENKNTSQANLKTDSLQLKTNGDSLALKNGTTIVKSVPDSLKGDLKTTVKYSSRDSSIIDEEDQTLYLYGDARVIYGDIELEAEFIKLNWKTNEVFAVGTIDTTSKEKIGFPVFTQGGTKYDADSIKYNFKSKKGLIKHIVTSEGEGFIQGQKVKKDAEDNMYLTNATYTTCDLEHPHFNILATKIKMVNGKNGNKSIIAGPFTLVLNDIPLPFKFPFGFFPFLQPKENGRSGIIFPTYGEEPRGRGFFLREGGYYFAINEYISAAVIGDIYSKGSFGLGIQSQYAKKYRYSGSLNFRFNANKTGDEYIDSKNPSAKDFNLQWSHSPVPRGTGSFSASVGLSSSGFGARNAINQNQYLQSASNSSVSYSKTFGTLLSASTAFRISQDMIKNVYQGGLGLNVAMNQINPLKSKNSVSEAWYETFRVGMSMNANIDLTNDIRSVQSSGYGEYKIFGANLKPRITPKTQYDLQNGLIPDFSQRVGVDVFKNWGAIVKQAQPTINYQIPITLPNFKILKYLNFTPSVSMSGNIYTKKLKYYNKYDVDTLKVAIDTTNGFFPVNTYGFNASMNTRVFGTVKFKKGRLQALRHTMAPSLSFNYTPDFSDPSKGFFQDVIINDRYAKGIDDITKVRGEIRRLSSYIGGSSSYGRSGSMNISISNNLEAKLKAKSDTAKNESEKISIIDNLGISASYNFLADSFKLSPISLNANSQIQKFSINTSATFDPYSFTKGSSPLYDYDPKDPFARGRRQNKFLINQGLGLAKLVNFGLNISRRFAPAGAEKKKVSNNASEEQMKFINKNPDLYVDFSIPWSLSVAYNLNYIKEGFAQSQVVQALTFSGDLSLTEKWKITFNSGYDFVFKALTYTNLSIHRDLHCWEMDMNWTPIAYGGRGGAYSFTLRARSSILQELKLAKRGSSSGYYNY